MTRPNFSPDTRHRPFKFWHGVFLFWLGFVAPAPAEISLEITTRSIIPDVDKVISERTSGGSLLHASALWRRDTQAFPAISDGVGLAMVFQKGKWGWGPELEFAQSLTAVDASRLTNGDTVADRSFTARLMTIRLGAQGLFQLKADRISTFFGGIKAGILINPSGIGDWQGGHLSLSAAQMKVADTIGISDVGVSVYGAITAGLRFYLFNKALNPNGAGLRIGVEYLVATESPTFREMAFGSKTWAVDTSGHKWAVRWDGLSLQVGLFFQIGDRGGD